MGEFSGRDNDKAVDLSKIVPKEKLDEASPVQIMNKAFANLGKAVSEAYRTDKKKLEKINKAIDSLKDKVINTW